MSDETKISVNIPTDENGMIGRECLECERYFKLKPGTGLPTDHCHCPYCEYEGDADKFWTPAQIEYAESIVVNQVIGQYLKPSLDRLNKSFKELERKTRNNFIQFKFQSSGTDIQLPIKHYDELELETSVLCDSCGLEFAVFGVFARCPDCKNLNAFLIYTKSIETTYKKLEIFMKPDVPIEIRNDSFKFILSDCIAAFDALGKELRSKKTSLFPDRPKNLFQNIFQLNKDMGEVISKKHSHFDFLHKMFQVRHLFEHNMGVIDDDFIKKIPAYKDRLGMKYKITEQELNLFINSMRELGSIVESYFEAPINLDSL